MASRGLYGVFPIYKPSGYSTSSILNMIKKSIGVEQISHSGALNRYAEGLMVLGVGKADRYNKTIQKHERMYLVRGMMGVATTSYDSKGDYVKVAPYYHVTESTMTEALKEVYVGRIVQTPPSAPVFRFLQRERGHMSSSVVPYKHHDAIIRDIELIDFDPPSFQLHVHTIGRIYPCTLVHNLGETLDSASHLTHLCRVKQGDFGFREALHYYDWDRETIQSNLYLPSNDPELNK